MHVCRWSEPLAGADRCARRTASAPARSFLPVPSSVFLPLRPAASGSAACLPLCFRPVRGVRSLPAPSTLCASLFWARSFLVFLPCALLHRAPRPACRSVSVPCVFGCDFSESPSSAAASGRGFCVNLLRSRVRGRKDGSVGIAPISCTYSTLRPAVPASAPAHLRSCGRVVVPPIRWPLQYPRRSGA